MSYEKHCSIHGGSGDGSDGCVECDDKAVKSPKTSKKAIDMLREGLEAGSFSPDEKTAVVCVIAIVDAIDALRKPLLDVSFEMEMLRERLPDIAKAINSYTEARFHTTR